MKVLKKGRDQRGWSTEAKCTGLGNGGGGCGAKLLVEQSDVFVTRSHSRDETTAHATFVCAHCGRPSDLGCVVPFTPREMTDEERAVFGLAPIGGER